MKCANKALVVIVIVSSLGLWGCTQSSNNGSAKLRDLESRHGKLEEDYRNTVLARDQAKKRLATLEEQRAKLTQQLEATVKEREDVRRQLSARVGERDAMQAQLMQFSKDLQNLAGKVEAAAHAFAPQGITAAAGTMLPTKEVKSE